MNMNRQERRNLVKQGAKKDTVDRLAEFEKPAKLKEVVSIARAVAQDVASEYVEDYRKRSAGVIMALTLQVELLKKLVIEHGIITEEDFNKQYELDAVAFEEAQKKYIEEQMKLMEEQSQMQGDAAEEERPDVSAKSDVSPVGPVDLKILK